MTNFAINEIPQKTSLIRGDCFEVFKNPEFCKDNSVDLILSDPPYGVNFSKIQGDKKYYDIAFKRIEELNEKH